MSARRGWDWQALELLREWGKRPIPDDFPMGGSIVHRPTGTWFSFGEMCGDELIAISHQGEPVVLRRDECKSGWLPESDPQKFESELQERRARHAAR